MKILKFNDYINETLNDICYHGTTLESGYNIIKTNAFILSYGTKYKYDNITDKTFYFSTTRSKNLKEGYLQQIRYNESYFIILTLDGNKLNNNYKSIPYDFHSYSNSYGGTSKSINFSHKISRPENYEMEDRIITNKPFINNATNYIKKVDFIFNQEIFDDVINQDLRDTFNEYNAKYLLGLIDLLKEEKIEYNISLIDNVGNITNSFDINEFNEKYLVGNNIELEIDSSYDELYKNWIQLFILNNLDKDKNEILNIISNYDIEKSYIEENYDNLYKDIIKKNRNKIENVIKKANSFDYNIFKPYDKLRIETFTFLKKLGKIDKLIDNLYSKQTNLITEELNFTTLVEPPLFKQLSNGNYAFKIEGNDIDVSFKNNAILTGIKKAKYIERIYRINMSFNDTDSVSNPKQILDGVNYCTELYLKSNNIELLAIIHIDNSPNYKEKNKRALYNKLYLEPMAKRLGYEYKLITNTDSTIKSNIAFSFIYKKSKDNELIINKIVKEELDSLREEDIDDLMSSEFIDDDSWLDNF